MRRMVVLAAVVAAGCSSSNPDGWLVAGLPPTVEALNFTQVIQRQNALISNLQTAADFSSASSGAQSNEWFEVYKAGVALIDGQCSTYINDLFRFNRLRLAGQTTIAQTGAATATIMGLASAGQTAIAITAAAFGLASSLFDATTATVLFAFEPSTIRSIVVQSMATYREQTFRNGGNYRSRSDVVLGLQGYLSLCTPAAIEARINDAGSDAVFQPRPFSSADPSPGLDQFSDRPLLSTSQPIITPPASPTNLALNLLEGEPQITRAQARRIQRALCNAGEPDGDLGGDGSNTRRALAEAQAAFALRGIAQQPQNPGRLRLRDVNLLADTQIAACDTARFTTAFERFGYGLGPTYAEENPAFVRALQEQLGLEGSELTGRFDQRTREELQDTAPDGIRSDTDLPAL